ncbi:MAG: hypothetical protein QXP36_14305 [Conexivisphaerales archaeon]
MLNLKIMLFPILIFIIITSVFIFNAFFVKYAREVIHNKNLKFVKKMQWLFILTIPIVGVIIYRISKAVGNFYANKEDQA